MDFNDNAQDDEKKIHEEISEKFFSKLRISEKGLALIPVKYPRYFGVDFEPYREKYCGKKIKGHDFNTLEPGEWLNDMIVNYYLDLIVNRSKKDPSMPKVYTFNSFFYNAYRKNKYDGIKSWINDRIFDFDYILLPVHERSHWFMIIADVNKKIIGSFDSLSRDNSYHLEHVRKILVTHAEASDNGTNKFADWEIFCDKTAPRQKNGFDCGVYACQFAQYITKGRLLDFQQSQMNYFRKRMQYELLKNRILKD